MTILYIYLLSVAIFFLFIIKDAEYRTFKVILTFMLLSFAWPFILLAFYLSDKEA